MSILGCRLYLSLFFFSLAAFGGPFGPGLLFAAEEEGTASFVAGFEDLPLMPGLNNVAEGSLTFDTTEGRIIESLVQGKVALGDAMAFYALSLPSLGWEVLADQPGSSPRPGSSRYVREDEMLRLDVLPGRGDEISIRFFLSPRKAAPSSP